MTLQFEHSVIRILSKDGHAIGLGFLALDKKMVTCAHVVLMALKHLSTSGTVIGLKVNVDFPFISSSPEFLARVVMCSTLLSDDNVDMAVLEIEGALPPDVSWLRLTTSQNLWGHPFRAFGFPAGYERGVWASGVLRGELSGRWVQIEDTKGVGYRIEPGFSGGPVWDEQIGSVVGMIVATDIRPDNRAAFMIPAAVLIESLPWLVEYAIPACPYRGLLPFREQDAIFYFGRDNVVDQLVRLVNTESFATIIGSSGSGKSSVLHAGLLPRLRAKDKWWIVALRPKDRPFYSLAEAFVPLLEPAINGIEQLIETSKLSDALRCGAVNLIDVATQSLQGQSECERLLIIVDQFEEIYTLCSSNDERQSFILQLLSCTQVVDPLRITKVSVLIALRADFLSQALSFRLLADQLDHACLMLGPMTEMELRQVIEMPANNLGIRVEDGLTHRILESVESEPGNLPLLEFALTILWARQESGKLTHRAYNEIGGVKAALAKYAEDVFDRLSNEEKEMAQQVFIQLIRPGEETADTRQLGFRRHIGDKNWSLVAKLADARLVVTGIDHASGEETAELAHEALITAWSRLHLWMEEAHAFRIWQEQVRGAMRQWMANKFDSGPLLRGVSLANAEKWLELKSGSITQPEKDFIVASRKEDERIRAMAHELAIRREMDHLSANLERLVSQALFGMKLLAQTAIENSVDDQKGNHTIFSKMLKVADETSNEVGFILEELRSPIKELGSLFDGLDEYVRRIKKWYRLEVIMELDGDRPLSGRLELMLLSLAREALNNAVFHSHCDTVIIRYKSDDEYIEFSIIDNGIGFDRSRIPHDTFGLKTMHDLELAMHGDLQIISASGAGTQISLRTHNDVSKD